MPRLRLAPNDRHDEIIAAAVKLAQRHRYDTVTRKQIADACSCAVGLVSHYLGDMKTIRRAIMREAVKQGILPIIAQGVVDRNRTALRAPPELITRAMASLA